VYTQEISPASPAKECLA